MRGFFCALVGALLFASPAAATLTRNAGLEQLASNIRGGAHIEVYCDDDQAGWNARHNYAAAVTDIVNQRVFLGPETCGHIQESSGPNRLIAFYVLLHELMHTTWMHDEGATDCWALFWLRYELRKQWHVTAQEAESGYQDAWVSHRAQTAEYDGGCVPEPDRVSVANRL